MNYIVQYSSVPVFKSFLNKDTVLRVWDTTSIELSWILSKNKSTLLYFLSGLLILITLLFNNECVGLFKVSFSYMITVQIYERSMNYIFRQ